MSGFNLRSIPSIIDSVKSNIQWEGWEDSLIEDLKEIKILLEKSKKLILEGGNDFTKECVISHIDHLIENKP